MTDHAPSRTSNLTRGLSALGAAVAIFGLLWAVCNFVSGGLYPIRDLGVGNLLIALALLVVGVVLILIGVTRPRVAR